MQINLIKDFTWLVPDKTFIDISILSESYIEK